MEGAGESGTEKLPSPSMPRKLIDSQQYNRNGCGLSRGEGNQVLSPSVILISLMLSTGTLNILQTRFTRVAC